MSEGKEAATSRDILRQRARALALEPVDPRVAAAGLLEVVEFVVGGERYAIESTALREVYPLKDLTPVPCTPAFVVGMINVRGQILAVIDFRKLFDLPAIGLSDLNKVLILEDRMVRIGILADAVLGVRGIAASDVQMSLATLTGIRTEYLRGVTGEGVVVLDARRILSSERLTVCEEVDD